MNFKFVTLKSLSGMRAFQALFSSGPYHAQHAEGQTSKGEGLMNGKKALRVVLDVLLTLMIVFEMFIQYTGWFLHEVVGFAFFATVVVHLALSFKWMKGTARLAKAGRMSGRQTALAVMGSLLGVTMVVLGVSSVAISGILESAGFVWPFGAYALWVTVHGVSSYALCALVAIHLAMHWAFLASAFKVPYNPERRQAIGAGVHAVAAVGAIALGVTAARQLIPASAIEAGASQAVANQPETSQADASQSDASQAAAPAASRKGSKGGSRSGSSTGSTGSTSSNSSASPSASGNSAGSSSSTTVTGTCTLCHKRCSLSSPQCDKPYQAGLISR